MVLPTYFVTVVLGPTWAYVYCDKLLSLGHTSVGVRCGTLFHSRHCVER